MSPFFLCPGRGWAVHFPHLLQHLQGNGALPCDHCWLLVGVHQDSSCLLDNIGCCLSSGLRESTAVTSHSGWAVYLASLCALPCLWGHMAPVWHHRHEWHLAYTAGLSGAPRCRQESLWDERGSKLNSPKATVASSNCRSRHCS